jgi:DNA-binding transcriptional MocR family regulator
LEHQIQQGAFRLGEQVPSVRELSRQHRVSVSTVLQAYFWLENRGWIEAKPKSGFYVRTPIERSPEPEYRPVATRPVPVEMGELALEVVQAAFQPAKISFGAACPSPDLLPTTRLNAIMRRISRENPTHSERYESPPGILHLRQEIAKRSIHFGCNFLPEDLTITCGAMEGLNLCLRAVAQPGDVIATETPTYFNILQAIQSLGLKVIEIPTHPHTGMDLDCLEDAIKRHRVRACVAITNCHNPLGYVLSDERKKALADLLARHDVSLIEDDVYGDLAFATPRPRITKSFDRDDRVMVCGSFSKTVSPGLRVGWVHGARYKNKINQLKLITSLATSSLAQITVATFLESGGYDRQLRRMRAMFEQQVQLMSHCVSKYFPAGTRVSRPTGGYVLWIELPEPSTDTIAIYRTALQEGISITPGPIFSASGKFRNCIRLSCGRTWSSELESALARLGRLCGADQNVKRS